MKSLTKLLGASAGSTEITAALEMARADLETATAAVAAAESQYEDGLLSETGPALRKLVDAKADAAIEADRSRALIKRLEKQLDTAVANEAEARRQEQFTKAKGLADAARKRLNRDYPKAAGMIRDLLRDLAEAEIEVAAANLDLPAGAVQLTGPEADRSVPTVWREVIAEDVVELWAGAGEVGRPLPPELQGRVVADNVPVRLRRRSEDDDSLIAERGKVLTAGGSWLETVRGSYRRTKILPDVTGSFAPNLASAVALPPLHAGDTDFWVPINDPPYRVIAELAKPLQPRPAPAKREPEFEYSLIRN